MDDEIESLILELCEARGPGKTICPSEVARKLFDHDHLAWRSIMPSVRQAAARLAERGVINVTQRGNVVDPEAATGPIRLGIVTSAKIRAAKPRRS